MKNFRIRVLVLGVLSAGIIIFFAMPYYSGLRLVKNPKSAPTSYKVARLNKLVAFFGAKNGLQEERVLRASSLYYFYLLTKNRNNNQKKKMADLISHGSSNARSQILADILAGDDVLSESYRYNIRDEAFRDRSLKLIIEDISGE